ncbi:hypothetical protein CFC21_055700, partial [Triticum aestivum]
VPWVRNFSRHGYLENLATMLL